MSDGPKPDRDPYEQPSIVRIKLVPDELAVAGCKTMTGAGPASSCRRTNCRNVGT